MDKNSKCFSETSDFEEEMYSYVEQALVKATADMIGQEEVLIGLAISTFDLNFCKSLYFEVNQNSLLKTWSFN